MIAKNENSLEECNQVTDNAVKWLGELDITQENKNEKCVNVFVDTLNEEINTDILIIL